ncbi:pseudoazurin [Sphingobium sp. AS12]|uniref:pseudoazurin n=1 Tax=Sphingobium sp. AS12 TaxID=2849495 RepID=UPI001C31D416|nr:pseudoazurin [Sphingobium sp. AS12]MBV2149352.1 pseudoazurin [Sphingobium sp. AS12]
MESDVIDLRLSGGLAAAALLLSPLPAAAKEFVVHMKNQGADGAMVFEPSFVKAAPGDTIRFKPSDPSHNAETMANMLPAGATPVKGVVNKEMVLTVAKPGLYGIKCMPHYSMGMVALVQVGKVSAAELTAAKAVKLPPFAAKRMTAALAKVK